MYTTLVHYKKWHESNNAHFDGEYVKYSKVVEVEKLTDLNNKFKNIEKIEILTKQ